MGVLERIRSLFLRPRAAAGPVLPSPNAADDPLLLVLRYSQDLGYLTQRPQRVEPSVLRALSALVDSGREELAIQHGLGLCRAIPTDLQLVQFVAETLCRASRYADALWPLEQALRLAPVDNQLRLLSLLATAHESLGDLESARRRLGDLLVLDVHYPEARRKLLALRPSASLPHRTGETAMAAAVQRAVLPTVAMVTQSRYELRAELGTGRTGTVYRALDRELGFDVALKVFHPHLRQKDCDDALLRALHEARLLSAARHPGIVALYHVEGDDLAGPGQQPLLAMELCRGGSLRTRLQSGPPAVDVALERSIELFDTLAELHAGGVAHGDVKPENLLFRGDGRGRYLLADSERSLGDLVIADFGLSRLLTGPGGVGVGTFGYLAWERYLGGAPSPLADVFSCAVVLLEMLGCGALPVGNPPKPTPDAGAQFLAAADLGRLGEREAPLRAIAADLLTSTESHRPSAAEAAQRLRCLVRL